ncbi:ATP-binding protein [Paenibacillus gansuensis]|uniref:histidine kinase n=1 Tax=Paenibacillus gansuensis TaxID=306542 RepID=A0ABW5PAF1_9BACL
MFKTILLQELHGLMYFMSAALLYLVITPTRLYTTRKRQWLFIAILAVLSYFYLFYEDIRPEIYVLHLIPVCVGFTVLYEGRWPAICTWAAFNFGNSLILHNEILPVISATTVMLAVGLAFQKKYTSASDVSKYFVSVGILTLYLLMVSLMNPSIIDDVPFFLLTVAGSYLSTLLTTFLYANVKRQEIVKEKLIHAEKYHLIGQLAASISHEIRNPLTISRGFMQMMRKPSLEESEIQRYVALSLEGIDQANSIITDYLNFAKPNIDVCEPLDLNQEIRSALPFVSSLAALSNVEIVLQSREETPVIIMGDSKKLRQCLLNLTKNAIEAMPDGGRLTIETLKSHEGVELHVKDTGIGMFKDQLKSAGLPFYTTKEKGTGLGLMVVTSMLKTMNGRISFDSKPNQGTQCRIVFRQTGSSGKSASSSITM